MPKLLPALPLNGFFKQWTGLSIRENYRGELVSLACAIGEEDPFKTVFEKSYGELPRPNEVTEIKNGRALWTGQNQYMLMLNGENINADIDVGAKLGSSAYATLQSDGWASILVDGEKVFDVLERFIPLDLRRAPQNFGARTSAHHIAVIIMKTGDNAFQLLTPRSSARSFLEGLLHTAENVFAV